MEIKFGKSFTKAFDRFHIELANNTYEFPFVNIANNTLSIIGESDV